MSTKEAKEQFVSGHTGGSLLETHEPIMVCLTAYLCWKAASRHVRSLASRDSIASLGLELMLLVVPCLVSVTFTDLTPTMLLGLSTTAMVLLMTTPSDHASSKEQKTTTSDQRMTTRARSRRSAEATSTVAYQPFSMTVRSSLQLLTVIAILAVDFRIFPRRFAKTETFGTSLMDLGVGAFVFSNGLVAGPRLKGVRGSVSVIKAFKISAPVVTIGVLRTILTKGVNYQEHVTEYGVHWNFFYTLGLIPVFTALLQWFLPSLPLLLSAVFIAVGYETLLSSGLEDIILNAPREGSLFLMNREGICSFFGYMSIFLFSAYLGSIILSPQRSDAATAKPKERSLAFIIGATGALFVVLVALFCFTRFALDIRVSRRMANISYSLWVLAVTVGFTFLSVLIDVAVNAFTKGALFPLGEDESVPLIFESVNRNQLAFFLLANLLTGAVNLTIDTLSSSPTTSFAILLAYSATICSVCVLWNLWGFKLKL